MRSEIRNIKVVLKYGAFGRTDAMGMYIYGKRRDGRTVPCKSEVQPDGKIQIWSSYAGRDPVFLEEDMTEFSAAEWSQIRQADGAAATRVANLILEQRVTG